MGVVYFSIIPTFEPSRYCKCWIVCFYDSNNLVTMHSECVVIVAYKKEIKREKQEGL